MILKKILFFWKSEPRDSYKKNSYKKKVCTQNPFPRRKYATNYPYIRTTSLFPDANTQKYAKTIITKYADAAPPRRNTYTLFSL